MAEGGHRVDLVLGHSAERVVCVIGFSARLRAVAVAAEVGCDDRELLGERRSDLVPHHERLRAAVQQQEWRAASADDKIDRGPLRGVDALVRESFEHPRQPFENLADGAQVPRRARPTTGHASGSTPESGRRWDVTRADPIVVDVRPYGRFEVAHDDCDLQRRSLLTMPPRTCNRSQPAATVFAYLSPSRGRPVCDRLPRFAPARLYKRSMFGSEDAGACPRRLLGRAAGCFRASGVRRGSGSRRGSRQARRALLRG
jgi:hypothetical protein